ncbi:MAG: hypothetical protein MMC33_002610 [Icmadophila ericetorum]|nr:hypothetical protein [Icmadophila ericetorum]
MPCIMKLVLAVGLVASSVSCLNTSGLHDRYVVKDSHSIPDGWINRGPAPGDHPITLHVGLREGMGLELEQFVNQVSDPDSPRYGQYLSKKQLDVFVRPTNETLRLTEAWLSIYGFKELEYSSGKDRITLRTNISVAEILLNTTYYTYEHREDGTRVIRTPGWSLPAYLLNHINLVSPTNALFIRQNPDAFSRKDNDTFIGQPENMQNLTKRLGLLPLDAPKDIKMPLHPKIGDACYSTYIAPVCLKVLYGFFDYQVKEAPKNHMAVANFNGDVTNRGDLEIFLEEWKIEAARTGVAYDFPIVHVKDQIDDQNQKVDGSLTAEIALGLAWPVPFLEYRVGGFSSKKSQALRDHYPNLYDPFLLWLHTVLDEHNPPQTIAITHGWDEQDATAAYSHSVCNGFKKLAARGVTVLVNSGDHGFSGSDPKNACSNKRHAFVPRFPASCPYVTTVGATMGLNPEEASIAQRWTLYFWPSNNIHALIPWISGAGFSKYFPRPEWQKPAVEKYLKKSGMLNEFPGQWNQSGRAYPDISANGVEDAVTVTGWDDVYENTALSTATMAAVIALVNDALLSAGKPPLGWLNPWLYKRGYKGFTDVRRGAVHGCATVELDAEKKVQWGPDGPKGGFPATEGWDVGSGWGTPWFPRLKELALDWHREDPVGVNVNESYPPFPPGGLTS